jgi:hypothetical protein
MPISPSNSHRIATPSDHSDLISWLAKSHFISDDSAESLNDYVPKQIFLGNNLLIDSWNLGEPDSHRQTDFDLNGVFTLGAPGQLLRNPEIDRCCFWLPTSSPKAADSKNTSWLERKSVCVASSRLSRKLDAYDSWFDAIRTMAARLDPKQHLLLTGAKTTTDTFVRRIAQLFGFPLLELRPFPKNVTRKWIQSCLADAHKLSIASPNHLICYFASLPKNGASNPNSKKLSTDQVVMAIAEELRLLSISPNGNVHKAALKRLAESTSKSDVSKSTKLLIDSRLTKEAVKSELISKGATAWWLYDESETHESETASRIAPPKSTFGDMNFEAAEMPRANGQSIELPPHPLNVPILELSEIQPERFLLHWTRRRIGAWPDQTQHEYLDDLIFRSSRRNHDDLSAIARILASRKLIGSNQLTRDCNPVVCFSNIPITELTKRTVFRKHLGRWDFQPFGIAIDRDVLMELGVKPVIYGDQQDWEEMSFEDRPYFQLAASNSQIDWREEQEWRLVGNLDLKLVGSNSAVVFVSTISEAEIIAPISRWPIVILAGSENSTV